MEPTAPDDPRDHRPLDPALGRELARPDAWAWISRALGEWVWIGLALAFAHRYWSPLGVLLAAYWIGTRQHALAMLAHDGAHGAISRNRRVNDLVTGLLAFWPLYGNLHGYRRFHFRHHRWTGQAEDPEHEYKRQASPDWDLPFTGGKLARLLVGDLLGLNFGRVVLLGKFAPPEGRFDRAGLPLWGLGAALATWHLGIFWVALPWNLGFMTSHWAAFRLRALTEHVGTRDTHRIDAPWWARSLFVPQNTWYHWEHHRYPAIPSWQLWRVREALGHDAPPVRPLVDVLRDHFRGPVRPAGIVQS
jgi:fatty acid desaturase